MNLTEQISAIAQRRRFGMKPGLDRMVALMDELGNPEAELLAIHVAGTNGKGSVCAMIASVLNEASFGKTGLYTSPHLVYFNERIRIGKECVSNGVIQNALDILLPAISKLDKIDMGPSFFEAITALAFLTFKQQGVKLAVIETGLGGRLDATNIITPLLSVITNVGLEHCAYLGDTIEQIAFEKAGIIKQKRPVVLGNMQEAAYQTIKQRAKALQSPVFEFDSTLKSRTDKNGRRTYSFESDNRSITKVSLPLEGDFQSENLTTAINALETFSEITGIEISEDAYRKGLTSVIWPCRFQRVSSEPTVIVDGGHNPPAIKKLIQSLAKIDKPLILVAGFCEDKDILGALKLLKPCFVKAYATETPSQRTLPSVHLAGLMQQVGFKETSNIANWKNAVFVASREAQETNSAVIVLGSLFLAGAVANYFEAFPWHSGIKLENEILEKRPPLLINDCLMA